MNTQINEEKRFFIHTLGCKVNQYESQAIRELLVKGGFKECLTKEIADIYIVNTCTVTHKADKESRYWLGMFHKTNPNARIVVTGCYVETNADDVSFLPGVAHIVKNEDKSRIAEILKGLDGVKGEPLSITGFKGHEKAFVKIQDGCENRCSYCKVPLVRGPVRSKPLRDIVREVEGLVANGFKEIVLAGICLGTWGKDPVSSVIAKEVGLKEASLKDVLKSLDSISGDFRIRLSSIELRYVTDELIEFIAGTKKMCRHLHIPLQSGDDEILKRMNRPYSAKDYMRLINKIKRKVPDIAITTDMLIGFPGESDKHFRNTVNFIKEMLPARTHIFTFSRRKGTAAYDMGQDLKIDVLKKRYHELRAATLSTSYLFRRDFLGREFGILVEAKRDKQTGMLSGYTGNYIKVHFEGPDSLTKSVVPVKIKEASLLYTIGEYDRS
ncbi:MAG: tRNA (N(6)-L-threonylcarbamoyladenosine(37)-C(2))-methylthiotransferase MtaB [Candidatus Omnitrophota bacterium]|nr:tRNA (N(6)-L-threonylcarbamoyladenosine(37)-C(2))-methylthiotransferase MtaB [Candidatus Omnitrophota bacterium]